MYFDVIGSCVPQPEMTECIKFTCPVRSVDYGSVSLTNATNTTWTIKPKLTGAEWSGPGIVEISPKGIAVYRIKYHPTTMTQEDAVHRVNYLLYAAAFADLLV